MIVPVNVTVVGCDGRRVDPSLLRGATLVVGAARLLSEVDVGVETLILGPLAPALERIISHEGNVAVLASGDPGFFGIVRALRAAGIRPRVVPAVSSVAAAFARVGLDWDDAVVVSAHGRDLRRAVNVCRAHAKVAVLTGPGCGPAELAAELEGTPRTMFVAESLGTAAERMSGLDGAPWADPNVVLVIDPMRVGIEVGDGDGDGGQLGAGASSRTGAEAGVDSGPRWIAGARVGPAGWALPESAFAHRDSMITKAEVRALVLARLGPRVGDMVWDVGSGSGSVAAECGRFGAAVIAVDRDPRAAELLARNAAGLDGGGGVRVVTGTAPACLAGLPDPDAVFVGGGGLEVLAACAARRPVRLVMAAAALERVGPALRCMGEAGYATEGVALQASRLQPLPDGSHRLAPVNPVFVLSGRLSSS